MQRAAWSPVEGGGQSSGGASSLWMGIICCSVWAPSGRKILHQSSAEPVEEEEAETDGSAVTELFLPLTRSFFSGLTWLRAGLAHQGLSVCVFEQDPSSYCLTMEPQGDWSPPVQFRESMVELETMATLFPSPVLLQLEFCLSTAAESPLTTDKCPFFALVTSSSDPAVKSMTPSFPWPTVNWMLEGKHKHI